VTDTTFTLKSASTSVAAPVTYDATSRTATLNPTANLAAGTTYTATLTGGTSGIKDTAGNPLTTVTWTFTTAAAPSTDTTAPTVTARTPAAGATGVSRTGNLAATFSEAVTGVGSTTFTLKTGTASVAATVSYNATTRVATLDPSADLAAGTQYTATLTGGTSAIRDAANNPLASGTWTFTTAAGDTTAPTVTARTPAAGATGVRRANPTITATFSEAVSGVSGTTVRLRTTSGSTVTASVSYNATTRVVTLVPGSTLASSTRYTVTLTGGATAIRDAAGNPLTTVTWTFTTGTLR